MNNLFKFLIVLVAVVLFYQTSAYLFANQGEAGGLTTIRLSDIKNSPTRLPLRGMSGQETKAAVFIPLLIYEIQVGSEISSKDEFVKLYNPNPQLVNLDGWSLKKKTKSGSEYNLVSSRKFKGKIISGGYFLIAHKEYRGNQAPDLLYSANSNHLAYSNNSVLLYNESGKFVDKFSYTKIKKGQILKRFHLTFK